MMHPDATLRWIDGNVGWGVMATRPIPAGTLVWVRDALDQWLPATQWRSLTEYQAMLDVCTYLDSAGDRHLLWDEAQFVNHSCSPNCHGTLYGFDIALSDIGTGEMLTNDYAFFGGVDIDFPCNCLSSLCRGSCGSPPRAEHIRNMAFAMHQAMQRVDDVHQPLAALVSTHRLAFARKDISSALGFDPAGVTDVDEMN
jgi:hypothetical protein